MELFLQLEGAYLVIAVFFMIITAFVTTRSFVPKVAFKRGMLGVGAFFVILIASHYSITTSRMEGVKELFNAGETVICENKTRRTVSRSVLLSKETGWRLEGDQFKNDEYERDFHTSRCIEFDGIVPK